MMSCDLISANSLAIAVYSSKSMTMVASVFGQVSRCCGEEGDEVNKSVRIVDLAASGATGLLDVVVVVAVAAPVADSFRPPSISLTLATRRRTSLVVHKRQQEIDPLSYRLFADISQIVKRCLSTQ